MDLRLEDRRLSRRRLLAGVALAAGTLAIGACARREIPTPTTAAKAASTAPPDAKPTTAATAAPKAATTAAPTTAAAPTNTPATQVKRGGTITAAMQNDWVSMDPIYNTGPATTVFMIYDPLFFLKPNESGEWTPIGGLVEQWEFDGNSAIFRLRQGVKFHDGSDWDAEVLHWNFDRWVNDPKSRSKAALTGVDFANPTTVIDSHTLRVNLTGPAPSLVHRLTEHTTFPISKAAFEKLGAEQYNRNPVGTGPFKFVEWQPSNRVVLTRNENYWMKGQDGQPLPYLDGITYRLLIEDSVRVIELTSHNIDFTELVQGKDLPTINADPMLKLLEADWCGNVYAIMFNSTDGPFSKDVRLRQAALYAIDREAMAATLGQGAGAPMRYMLLPGSMGYDESVPFYSYDLDKAKSLIAEAGYADGLEVSFPIISREVDKLQAEMLKQMWEQIGIRANIEVIERAAWVQKLITEKGNFDVATLRSGFSAGDPDLLFRTFQWSKGNFNVSRLEDPKMDDLIARASGTYDEAERAKLYREALRYNYELAYYDWLWMQKWNWVSSARLQGVPSPMIVYWDFRTAWVTD